MTLLSLETHQGDNGTDSSASHSCSLASITLLSRVGLIKLVLFVFRGFLYFKGVVGSDAPGPLLARSGRRMFPGEFLTGSPHTSAGKTYPPAASFP